MCPKTSLLTSNLLFFLCYTLQMYFRFDPIGLFSCFTLWPLHHILYNTCLPFPNLSQMKREELLTVWPSMCSCCWETRGRTVMAWKPHCGSHIWSCIGKNCEICWSCTPFTKSFTSEKMTGETQVIDKSFSMAIKCDKILFFSVFVLSL